MSEQFSASVISRICNHMNEDYADAVVLYAQAFGGLADATAASLVSIDTQGMDLTAQVNGEVVPVRIQFDHVLADALICSPDADCNGEAATNKGEVEIKGFPSKKYPTISCGMGRKARPMNWAGRMQGRQSPVARETFVSALTLPHNIG